MKPILASLSSAFFVLGVSSAYADDRVDECMDQAPGATEEYCSCMVSSVEDDPDLLAEIEGSGGMPDPSDWSDALKEAEEACRA